MDELKKFLDPQTLEKYNQIFEEMNDYKSLLIHDFLIDELRRLKKENRKEILILKINLLLHYFNYFINNKEENIEFKNTLLVLKKEKELLNIIRKNVNNTDLSIIYLYLLSINKIEQDLENYIIKTLKTDRLVINDFTVVLNNDDLEEINNNFDIIYTLTKKLQK